MRIFPTYIRSTAKQPHQQNTKSIDSHTHTNKRNTHTMNPMTAPFTPRNPPLATATLWNRSPRFTQPKTVSGPPHSPTSTAQLIDFQPPQFSPKLPLDPKNPNTFDLFGVNHNESFLPQNNNITLLHNELKEAHTKLARETKARRNAEAQNIELGEQLLGAKAMFTLMSCARQEDQVRNLLVLHGLHQYQNDPATLATKLELMKQVEEERETRIVCEKQCSQLEERVLPFKMHFHCEKKTFLKELAHKTRMGDIEKMNQAQIYSLEAAVAEANSKSYALQEQITFLTSTRKDIKKTKDKPHIDSVSEIPNLQLRRQIFDANADGSLLWLSLQQFTQQLWSKVFQ